MPNIPKQLKIMKTQISIIALAMLLGTEAKQINTPKVLAQAKKIDRNIEPVTFAQSKVEPVDEIAAAKSEAAAAGEEVIPDASETGNRPRPSCSDNSGNGSGGGSGSGSCSAFGRVDNIKNAFKRFGLRNRRLGTSYTTTGSRSRANNRSTTVECKPDQTKTDYSVTSGKGNGYSLSNGSNASIKRKVFNIDGEIKITERSQGGAREGTYNRNENAAKSKTKSKTYFKSAKGCKKFKWGKKGRRGDHSDSSCSDSDSDHHIGASQSTPDAIIEPPVVNSTE